MLKPYIRQLKSQDPAERRKAIAGLARLRNPAVIPLLETVSHSDPDPALRELAEKAIRYVNTHAEQKSSPATESLLDIPPAEDATPRSHVSPRDRETARKYVNAAFSYYQAGDRARAVEWLGKALSVNSEIQGDSFVEGIVQNVMQMDMSEALPILTHVDRRKAYIAELGGKQPMKAEHVPENATWGNVLIDFGLYGVVAIASQFAAWLFAADILQRLVEQSPQHDTQNIDAFFNMDTRGIFLTSLLSGVYFIVGAALQGVFTHLAARYMLGGRGSLAYLYRKLVPLQTIFLFVTSAALVLLGLAGNADVALPLLGLLNIVADLVLLYLTVRIVAEVHDFGMWSGCGAIILGWVLLIVIFVCGAYVLFMVLVLLVGGAG